jgi:hypothetical protein
MIECSSPLRAPAGRFAHRNDPAGADCRRISAMTKTLPLAAMLALPLMMAAGTPRAVAASPAAYCTFTSPASSVCPNEVAPPLRAPDARVTAADHCIALTPASSACPATPVAVASTKPERTAQLQASRN